VGVLGEEGGRLESLREKIGKYSHLDEDNFIMGIMGRGNLRFVGDFRRNLRSQIAQGIGGACFNDRHAGSQGRHKIAT
jgi:hypothetical protein